MRATTSPDVVVVGGGITGIGPATGELVRDLMLGQSPAGLAPFRLQRPAGQTGDGGALLYG